MEEAVGFTGEVPQIAQKYQGLIDITQKNNSHTIAYEYIESLGRNNLKILEVGCSSGYFG